MKYILTLLLSLMLTVTAFGQTDPNAKIDLTLVSLCQDVQVGEEIEVALMMNAATTPQRYIVSDIIFGWDTEQLEFIGISHEGSHPFIWTKGPAGLPCPLDANGDNIPGCEGLGDFYGINESMPPADGDGLYFGFGELGQVFIVDQTPVQIVKFKFKVIGEFDQTQVYFIPQLTVNYTEKTVVYGSYIPGMIVTGLLTNAVICGAQDIPGDIDGNGVVNSADMALLLSNWGVVSFTDPRCDINSDGMVDSADLTILLANWN